MTRILSDNNALHTQTGHIVIGWLVVEDIFTVLVLVLVPTLAGQGGQRVDTGLLSIGGAVGKIALLIAITFSSGSAGYRNFLDGSQPPGPESSLPYRFLPRAPKSRGSGDPSSLERWLKHPPSNA